MPDRQEEIARIQERIVEADLRVSAQIDRIERMIEKGYNVTEARDLLRQLESILDHPLDPAAAHPGRNRSRLNAGQMALTRNSAFGLGSEWEAAC